MGKRRLWLLAILFIITVLLNEPVNCSTASRAAAVRNVKTLAELELALRSEGDMVINLKTDITVSKCLRVKGNKVLNGGGTYWLRRRSAAGSTYAGTLLQMRGSRLRLKDITVSGSGKSPTVSGKINGKLIEIDRGTVVLESGTKLMANYNVSSFTDGGGGITVHTGGTALMKPGSSIRDNLTLTGGSAVRVEAGGMFVMEGGTIADNAVLGQRSGSDFDGRGGAIHNRGVVYIQGGTISGNVAAGYEKGNERHGGYGGAVYNEGVLAISGGRIAKNKGVAAGGAVYTTADSVLNVEGGEISGSGDVIYGNGAKITVRGGTISSGDCAIRTNKDCEIRGGTVEGGTYGVLCVDGILNISGKPHINSVYLAKNCVIDVDRKIELKSLCKICPENYTEGEKLVHISSGETADTVLGSFSLRKKNRFLLESVGDGLYIGREKYQIVFEANGGQGSMQMQSVYVDEEKQLKECTFWREGYGFAGWSERPGAVKGPKEVPYRDGAVVRDLGKSGSVVYLYALWVKRPVITSKYSGFVFYEQEYADSRILLTGMQASDACGGDLTKKIRIVRLTMPDDSELTSFDTLPTTKGSIGKGEILYEVEDVFGICAQYRQTYEVVPNEKPDISMRDRYYFVGEYAGKCSEQAKQDILSHMKIGDDVELEGQLNKNTTVLWGGLDFQTEGSYPVTVRIKDQYGHRFYMPEGVEKQYGRGKICEKQITVHVVKRENGSVQTERDGFVRFISEEYVQTLAPDSVWRTEQYADELAHTFQKDGSSVEEVWSITSADKKKIRMFLKERENPFSKETNDMFIQKFSYMKTERS